MSSQEPKAQLEPIKKVEGSATAIEVDHTHDPVASGADFDNESPWNFFLILSCFTVGASSVLFGYDDKIVSPVAAMTPFVERFQGLDPSVETPILTSKNQTLVFAVPLVGAIVGAVIASPLTTKFGRKWPIVGCYALSYGSTFMQTFAPKLAAFVVGRFINSILMAIAMTITPLYLSELVPAKYRGRAVTSANIFNLIAGVIGTVIANATHSMTGYASYQIPIGAQAVMPTFLIPLTALIPESPLWLVTKGRDEDALVNLTKLRRYGTQLIADELRIMRLTHERGQELSKGATFWDLFDKNNIQRTLVAGSMFSVNQVTGIILSTTYATVFLTQLGVGNAFQLTIASSCCTLAGTIIAPWTVDKIGRRPTALIGMSVLMVIDFTCGALAFFTDKKANVTAIAALSFILNTFWAASFYPLSLALPAEIPTPRLRNLTSAYTIGCSYITAVLTTLVVPQLTSADAANLGAKTYLVFGGLVAIILVFYYIYLPETARRTLVEIDELYELRVPPRKWAKHETSAASKQGGLSQKYMEEKV
ncbi:unnamed protein product [Clonostachys rosea f. rosea IK726]|uniref:Major facilitator superfamily (MFS) profile domain-containing protein n=2 Tax=Bionectria ochroleuca TaxID=29856 RepID=A0A0B7KFS5_BIOOC|nr:unnamed protein product [Clonostachys rosea f. rosea IK726]